MLKKISIGILSASLLLSMSACQKKDPKEEQVAFNKFMDTAFQTAMKQDYATAYTYMEHPSTYKISEDSITTTKQAILSNEQRDTAKDYIKKQLKELKSFSYDLLTDEQKVEYDTYKFMLERKEDSLSKSYRYLPTYFSTLNGIHLQIVDELKSINISSKEQIEKMITYVSSISSYIDQVLEYTKKQQEENTLLIDKETVKKQCSEVVDKKEKSELYTSLVDKINKTSLTDKEKESLTKSLQNAYTKNFIPAYEKIINTMDSISSSKDVYNLSDMKKGSSYYEDLFKQLTGSEDSVKDTLNSLEEKLKTAQKSELVVANKNMDLYEDWLDNKYRTELTSYEDVMKSLYDENKEKFPTVDIYDYKIQKEEKDTMGILASATSLPFAMDTTKTPLITINTANLENQVNSLQAFVSLAQAGIPGAYYMRLYQYQNLTSNWMKIFAQNNGYTQGFETYSALYALKSLPNVNKAVLQLQQKQIQYYNYALAIADIRIHYKGESKENIVTFLKSLGWSEKEAQLTYQTIVYNPGYYVTRGVGLMKFLDLYSNAKEKLGTKFKDNEFHEVLLKYGTTTFSVLEEKVDDYIHKVNKQ